MSRLEEEVKELQALLSKVEKERDTALAQLDSINSINNNKGDDSKHSGSEVDQWEARCKQQEEELKSLHAVLEKERAQHCAEVEATRAEMASLAAELSRVAAAVGGSGDVSAAVRAMREELEERREWSRRASVARVACGLEAEGGASFTRNSFCEPDAPSEKGETETEALGEQQNNSNNGNEVEGPVLVATAEELEALRSRLADVESESAESIAVLERELTDLLLILQEKEREEEARKLREAKEEKEEEQEQEQEEESEKKTITTGEAVTAIATARLSHRFSGGDWALVLDDNREELIAAFGTDMAEACGVPKYHEGHSNRDCSSGGGSAEQMKEVSDVSFSLEANRPADAASPAGNNPNCQLKAECTVSHDPNEVSVEELEERVAKHHFANVRLIYANRRRRLTAYEAQLSGYPRAPQEGVEHTPLEKSTQTPGEEDEDEEQREQPCSQESETLREPACGTAAHDSAAVEDDAGNEDSTRGAVASVACAEGMVSPPTLPASESNPGVAAAEDPDRSDAVGKGKKTTTPQEAVERLRAVLGRAALKLHSSNTNHHDSGAGDDNADADDEERLMRDLPTLAAECCAALESEREKLSSIQTAVVKAGVRLLRPRRQLRRKMKPPPPEESAENNMFLARSLRERAIDLGSGSSSINININHSYTDADGEDSNESSRLSFSRHPGDVAATVHVLADQIVELRLLKATVVAALDVTGVPMKSTAPPAAATAATAAAGEGSHATTSTSAGPPGLPRHSNRESDGHASCSSPEVDMDSLCTGVLRVAMDVRDALLLTEAALSGPNAAGGSGASDGKDQELGKEGGGGPLEGSGKGSSSSSSTSVKYGSLAERIRTLLGQLHSARRELAAAEEEKAAAVAQQRFALEEVESATAAAEALERKLAEQQESRATRATTDAATATEDDKDDAWPAEAYSDYYPTLTVQEVAFPAAELQAVLDEILVLAGPDVFSAATASNGASVTSPTVAGPSTRGDNNNDDDKRTGDGPGAAAAAAAATTVSEGGNEASADGRKAKTKSRINAQQMREILARRRQLLLRLDPKSKPTAPEAIAERDYALQRTRVVPRCRRRVESHSTSEGGSEDGEGRGSEDLAEEPMRAMLKWEGLPLASLESATQSRTAAIVRSLCEQMETLSTAAIQFLRLVKDDPGRPLTCAELGERLLHHASSTQAAMAVTEPLFASAIAAEREENGDEAAEDLARMSLASRTAALVQALTAYQQEAESSRLHQKHAQLQQRFILATLDEATTKYTERIEKLREERDALVKDAAETAALVESLLAEQQSHEGFIEEVDGKFAALHAQQAQLVGQLDASEVERAAAVAAAEQQETDLRGIAQALAVSASLLLLAGSPGDTQARSWPVEELQLPVALSLARTEEILQRVLAGERQMRSADSEALSAASLPSSHLQGSGAEYSHRHSAARRRQGEASADAPALKEQQTPVTVSPPPPPQALEEGDERDAALAAPYEEKGSNNTEELLLRGSDKSSSSSSSSSSSPALPSWAKKNDSAFEEGEETQEARRAAGTSTSSASQRCEQEEDNDDNDDEQNTPVVGQEEKDEEEKEESDADAFNDIYAVKRIPKEADKSSPPHSNTTPATRSHTDSSGRSYSEETATSASSSPNESSSKNNSRSNRSDNGGDRGEEVKDNDDDDEDDDTLLSKQKDAAEATIDHLTSLLHEYQLAEAKREAELKQLQNDLLEFARLREQELHNHGVTIEALEIQLEDAANDLQSALAELEALREWHDEKERTWMAALADAQEAAAAAAAAAQLKSATVVDTISDQIPQENKRGNASSSCGEENDNTNFSSERGEGEPVGINDSNTNHSGASYHYYEEGDEGSAGRSSNHTSSKPVQPRNRPATPPSSSSNDSSSPSERRESFTEKTEEDSHKNNGEAAYTPISTNTNTNTSGEDNSTCRSLHTSHNLVHSVHDADSKGGGQDSPTDNKDDDSDIASGFSASEALAAFNLLWDEATRQHHIHADSNSASTASHEPHDSSDDSRIPHSYLLLPSLPSAIIPSLQSLSLADKANVMLDQWKWCAAQLKEHQMMKAVLASTLHEYPSLLSLPSPAASAKTTPNSNNSNNNNNNNSNPTLHNDNNDGINDSPMANDANNKSDSAVLSDKEEGAALLPQIRRTLSCAAHAVSQLQSDQQQLVDRLYQMRVLVREKITADEATVLQCQHTKALMEEQGNHIRKLMGEREVLRERIRQLESVAQRVQQHQQQQHQQRGRDDDGEDSYSYDDDGDDSYTEDDSGVRRGNSHAGAGGSYYY